jgi:hypothetical protein
MVISNLRSVARKPLADGGPDRYVNPGQWPLKRLFQNQADFYFSQGPNPTSPIYNLQLVSMHLLYTTLLGAVPLCIILFSNALVDPQSVLIG